MPMEAGCKTTLVIVKQAKPPLETKFTKCFTVQLEEEEYRQLLELARTGDLVVSLSSIGRAAVRQYLRREQRKAKR